MRSELHAAVDIHQLEGHGKVLVAVSCEGALGLGREVHPATQSTNQQSVLPSLAAALLLAKRESLIDWINLPGGLGANALVFIHHREVHIGDSDLGGHLYFELVVGEGKSANIFQHKNMSPFILWYLINLEELGPHLQKISTQENPAISRFHDPAQMYETYFDRENVQLSVWLQVFNLGLHISTLFGTLAALIV